MNRTLLVATIASALYLAAGCKKPAATTEASATASATAPPPAAPVSTVTPTEEDFEQQALDDINPQNMEQELEKLEKEIEH